MWAELRRVLSAEQSTVVAQEDKQRGAVLPGAPEAHRLSGVVEQLEVGQRLKVGKHGHCYIQLNFRVQPFPDTLCHSCVHHHRVETARSVFLMCRKLPNKYPPQPVLQCFEFKPKPPEPPAPKTEGQ
jgi:hypothetical protein